MNKSIYNPWKSDVSPDWRWRIPMKTMMLTAVAVLSLGVGSAYAQGKPPGNDPGTAPQAFPNEPYHTGTVFSELFGHHTKSSPVVAHNATSTKGG
jgi:hypothetical protein